MYAIIETGGKQYKVAAGDVIRVEKLDVKEGDSVNFDKVWVGADNEVLVGTPYVSGKVVNAACLKQGKDKKVVVYKYKRKSGYHKKNGHRQLFTEVKINSIA